MTEKIMPFRHLLVNFQINHERQGTKHRITTSLIAGVFLIYQIICIPIFYCNKATLNYNVISNIIASLLKDDLINI